MIWCLALGAATHTRHRYIAQLTHTTHIQTDRKKTHTRAKKRFSLSEGEPKVRTFDYCRRGHDDDVTTPEFSKPIYTQIFHTYKIRVSMRIFLGIISLDIISEFSQSITSQRIGNLCKVCFHLFTIDAKVPTVDLP